MQSDERVSIVGQRLRRPDAVQKLTGYERYTDDLALPGMYSAHFVLSPHAHATIRGIDVDEAARAPAVVAVVTSRDLPEFARDDEPSIRAGFFLASERASYAGQPVAVVVARTAAEAESAAELVAVDYDPQPPVAGIEMARQFEATPVRPRTFARASSVADSTKRVVPNVNGSIHHQRGDVERAFRDAAICVEQTFDSHGVHQSYLEPRSVVASAEPNGRLTIYTPTQGQFMVRAALARVLRLAETDIRVEPMAVGGGFGGKMVLLEPLAALLAMRFKRPVKLTLTRQQDFLSTTPAPESRLTLALAADAEGLLTGLRADLWFDTGYFSNSPYQLVAQMIGSFYRIPNIDIRSTEVLSNRTGTGSYRAPGLTPMMVALETLVDELARSLDLSPLEFRLRNVAHEGDLMADGTRWPSMDLPALLREAERSSLWSTPCAVDEGVGLAIGGLRGGAESASASLRLNADGTLSVMIGSVDLTGTNTGLTQIAAEAFGVSSDQVRVTTASSDSAPQFGLTGGSKVLYSVGNAVLEAARDARAQAFAVAADRLEAGIDDLELASNRIQVRGAP
ncbi:MAG TPA: xanthine dehydrogenase family protein, partial [Nitrolancea sp.]|nr:xanthine dehydrogenase family protein [Nitrolancea sp.]